MNNLCHSRLLLSRFVLSFQAVEYVVNALAGVLELVPVWSHPPVCAHASPSPPLGHLVAFSWGLVDLLPDYIRETRRINQIKVNEVVQRERHWCYKSRKTLHRSHRGSLHQVDQHSFEMHLTSKAEVSASSVLLLLISASLVFVVSRVDLAEARYLPTRADESSVEALKDLIKGVSIRDI